MKVTLINTTDAGGGAPAACMRLLKALNGNGVDATMAVQKKLTTEQRVLATVGNNKARADFFMERLPFMFFHEKDKSVRFAFSAANSGTDITNNPSIQEADVLHLHWTNSGYLSLSNLQQLLSLGKPVVWTLHDMWSFTGGCHYSGDCDHYLQQCGNCWMLRNSNPADLSHRVWLRKAKMLQAAKNLTVVSCSHWLGEVARSSSLLKQQRITTIPNPIDVDLYTPLDKLSLRKRYGLNTDAPIILFGAANINDRRKGISYLIDALTRLKETLGNDTKVEVVVFGKNKHFDVSSLPFKTTELGMITSDEKLAEIYNLADVFVSPSLEDNLPNMIMEALACGVPVAAFNTGGIPDLIDHQQNGYLADYKSATDLANGLHYLLFNTERDLLATAARQKVLNNFTNELVASQYIKLYQSVLNSNNGI